MSAPPLSWAGIVRLGLVQTALGAIVVLTTATLNRVMVVELALPAVLPGALVALHYAIQITRPRFGYGSDVAGRRTPWIIGGMAVLALGGLLAAIATAWMASRPAAGVALAALAFAMIGGGVGASGTSLLVLLAKRVDERRRAAAATTVWVMMILGFIVTATTAGHLLDPFSYGRLVAVAAGVAGLAFLVTLVAVWGIEGGGATNVAVEAADQGAASAPSFRAAMAEVWAERRARRFSIFVFVSMLAYSAQDLILEPFAGIVFGLTPGESTKLSGVQHSGVLLGMVVVGLLGSGVGGPRFGSLRAWTVGGCIASAAALLAMAVAGLVGPAWPLRLSVFVLGVTNGVFAVAAIGSMMGLVSAGRERREGVRMGLWGAAQAIAFGLGGLLGTASVDLANAFLASPVAAYATVFASQAVMFLVAAELAARVTPAASAGRRPASLPVDDGFVAETSGR